MSVEELALGLSRLEKRRLMEAMGCDLIRQADTFKSPAWQEAALKETEARLAEGREAVFDLSDALRASP